jgi:hypothetical protein
MYISSRICDAVNMLCHIFVHLYVQLTLASGFSSPVLTLDMLKVKENIQCLFLNALSCAMNMITSTVLTHLDTVKNT